MTTLRERMTGRWHGVLPMLGVSKEFLVNRHGPCPICGGKDRFRFDDKDGNGSYFCNGCGAGDGIALVMKLNGWDYKRAALEIEKHIGSVSAKAQKPQGDPRLKIKAMRAKWGNAEKELAVVKHYLAGRGIHECGYRDIREDQRQCEMVALVRDWQGNGIQVHRTKLTPDGQKANVDEVRMFMPGPLPRGCAVRLLPPRNGTLGIAEGIETALSASILFGIPCWAALNTSLLKNWEAPLDITSITVFGDNDDKFAGQAAAYELGRRLSVGKPNEPVRSVCVRIPDHANTDWNDVLMARSGWRKTA